MGTLLFLEAFDGDDSQKGDCHPEFLRGLAAGKEAAQLAHADQQAVVARALQDAIEEARFSYAEARDAVLHDLHDIIDAAVTKILPSVATAGLAELVREELSTAVSSQTASAIRLTVGEDFADIFRGLISQAGPEKITLDVDPKLGPHVVWFDHDRAETCFDMTGLIDAVETALDALKAPSERTTLNG